MNFLHLARCFEEQGVILFSLQDIRILYPKANDKTLKNNLSNWVKKGYIHRLKKGLYTVNKSELSGSVPDFYLANRLYPPSYVSLETALSFYGIIPEEAAQIISVSTKPTRIYSTSHGTFFYRSCKKSAFTGYRIMKIQGEKTLFADKEKALVDYIYFRLKDGQTEFADERFDTSKINQKKSFAYAKKFNKKTVEKIKEVL